MNPLILLFGLFGAGAMTKLGGGRSFGHSGHGNGLRTSDLAPVFDETTSTGGKGGPKPDILRDEMPPVAPATPDPVEETDPIVNENTAPPVEGGSTEEDTPSIPDTVEEVDPVVNEDTAPPVEGGSTEEDTPDAVEEAPDTVEETDTVVNEDTAPPVEGGSDTPTTSTPVVQTDPVVSEDTTSPIGGSSTPTTPTPVVQSDPVVNPTPTAPTQTGSGTTGGNTPQVAAQGTVDVMSGRVATLTPSANDITGLRIVSGVQNGNVTVNPDNTLAVVMTQSNFVGSQNFTYEATHSDGSTTLHQVDLNVTAPASSSDWTTGTHHYMLETDANDNVVVEYGDNHRAVYISGSNNALSLSDIAAQQGLSVNQITGSWLASSDYGKTEATALDLNAGMSLWNTVSPYLAADSSNWLMFERGYTYDGYGDLLNRGVDGESELHPVLIGAWGQGEHPVMQDELFVFAESSKNVVIQGLHFTDGVTFLDAHNIILDDLILTDDSLIIQNGSGFSVRNSAFYDIKNTQSEGVIQNGKWTVDGNRVAGTYIDTIDGLLFEGNFFDLNGWSQDYELDASATGGQPPIMFNHNVYIQTDNLDVTVRDTITMRAASIGMQVRSGGFIEDNVYIDNNVAGNFSTISGTAYSLFTDNVITNAAGRPYHPDSPAAMSAGIDSQTSLSSLVDNIITHLADPNGAPTTIQWTDWSYDIPGSYYDDTIVYNWQAADGGGVNYITEQNVTGLDTAALDQTTIQNFAAQLLGSGNGTIDALAQYLRDQANGIYNNVVDADVIVDFFQRGFGIAPSFRTAATTLEFVPDDLGEGIRWDNRLNWSTDDQPGLYSQDSVDLRGNNVVLGQTTTIDTLDISGGSLDIYGGRLTTTGGIQGEGGSLTLEGTGQIWTNGSDGTALDIDVTGGRFANTGAMSGADLTATGGQTILATGGGEYDVDAGQTLTIAGVGAKAGFDGDDGGLAILDLHANSTLAFGAAGGDLGEIAEFRSGAFGDTPDVSSGIDLGGSSLNIDLSGLSAAAGTTFTLMSADELVGLFSNAVVGGLGGRDANILIDYAADSVTLQLSSGSGGVSVQTVGNEADVTPGAEALWSALTADQGVVTDTQSAIFPTDPLDDVDLAA